MPSRPAHRNDDDDRTSLFLTVARGLPDRVGVILDTGEGVLALETSASP